MGINIDEADRIVDQAVDLLRELVVDGFYDSTASIVAEVERRLQVILEY